MATLEGIAGAALYRSDDGEFGVLIVECDKEGSVRVSGSVCNAIQGLPIICQGVWADHPKHGQQFKAQSVKTKQPTDGKGVVTYLGSELIDGVGPVMAQRIYDHFGAETLNVIKNEPKRLREVDGIGKARAEKLANSIHHQVAIEEIAVWLFDQGIGENLAMRIYRHYGLAAMDVLNDNPYVLAADMFGVGFKTADKVAKSLGIDSDDPKRLRAGIDHTLSELESQGNTMASTSVMLNNAARILGAHDLSLIIREMTESQELFVETTDSPWGETCQRRILRAQEVGIAKRLSAKNDIEFDKVTDKILKKAQKRAGLQLDDSQLAAARAVCENGLSVITGRPGTGKTATLRVVLHVLDQLKLVTLLASPTGKAARRMTEATGREAATVHRTLAYDPGEGGFAHHDENPLLCDVLVLDEASMLDTRMMFAVCKALATRARLILVGDTNQLPSVGPGRVLADIIESGVASVNELTKIHRQAAESAIITGSHAIIEGRVEDFVDGQDLRLIDYSKPDALADKLPKFVGETLPAALGHIIKDPVTDVQVLTGTHRGPLGTRALNKLLGAALNPDAYEFQEHRGLTYAVGDKIIVNRNNYDLCVFNGTLGRIRALCAEPNSQGKMQPGLEVKMEDGAIVRFIGSDRDDIDPGWALTVHKTQGSEFPVTVMVVDNSQYVMLDRNWLYTGVSRAQKYAIVIGAPSARKRAIENVRSDERMTLLKTRLSEPALV